MGWNFLFNGKALTGCRAISVSWEHDRQHQQAGVEVADALTTKDPGLGQRWG